MKQSIRVYNNFLDLLTEIDTYQSFQFGRSYHGIAQFELHINRYMQGAGELRKGNIIVLGKQSHKSGIIVAREIVLDEQGKETENIKLTGFSLNALILRRVTVPPSHTSHDRKSGDAETVMKHYINNHFVNPSDPKRKFPRLIIAQNKNRGGHVEYESRFKTVSEELEMISRLGDLGWLVYPDFKLKQFVFDVYEGKDVTQGNPYGNSPVFFSPEFETIKSQSFIDSDIDLRNFGYVGGQGEGIEREIVTVGNASGWDRIETFIDARDIGDEDEETEEELPPEEVEKRLKERGERKLNEMQTLLSFEAEILTPITRTSYEYTHEGYRHPAHSAKNMKPKQQQITPFEYEKDFDLGYVVDVVNKSWGITMKAPITEFLEIYEPSGFRLEATFGESRPTLITKLKKKFDEIEGVDKQEVPSKIVVKETEKTREYVDEKVIEEARERIQQAEDNLNEAKNFAKDARNITEGAFDVGTVPIRTAETGERLEYGNRGIVQYDENNEPVSWFGTQDAHFENGYFEGEIYAQSGHFSGDVTGSTGTFGQVSVNEGDLTVKDKLSNTKAIVTPLPNLIWDHSFESVLIDINTESETYNWCDMKQSAYATINYPYPFWIKTGSPKVAMIPWYGEKDYRALPIFDDQAIVVRNANFVRQYLTEGVGAGGTYSISGYFKRHWKQLAGVPRFEVDHVHLNRPNEAERGRTRLINHTYDRVPNDYTPIRFATTFTVPVDFNPNLGDYLDVKVSGGDDNWVQCDGVQLVAYELPTIYNPETLAHRAIKMQYWYQTMLWQGEYYLNDAQIVIPDLPIDQCKKGWILLWQAYNPGSGIVNSDFQTTHIPKTIVMQRPGAGHRDVLARGGVGVIGKYFYVHNDRIVGHASNQDGIAKNLVLSGVLEW